MNHADIKKRLADYLEGELPIDQRALVDAHLDACDSCAGEVEEMLQTINLLRTLPEPEIPPMIAANVMRRIRSGESELGFFGRVGRVLGGVLEPGFVLPASAIAVAALVFSVVQGLGDGSMSGIARFADQGELTTASLPSSFALTRRNERLRTARARDFSNGRDFVARVERLATESDRRIQSGLRLQVPFAVVGSGSRIQIRFGEALTIRGSNSESGRVGNQNVWAPDLSGIMAGNERDWTSAGRLVAAERWGTSDVLPGSGVWSPTVAQGDFLMGRGDSVGSFGSQGRDPRDAWLALGFEDPTEFARYIAGRNLAEQELWATRLSERAEARGLLTEFLSVLRDSGDPTATWVADDFSAQAELASQRSSEFAEQFTR